MILCYILYMIKKFKYSAIDPINKFRFVGKGSWKECLEFIVSEFKVYRQWVLKIKEHIGKKMNHFDVKILFLGTNK
ncbi:MAG: hypothetical protein CVT92_02590 [Bacteroidetes bacterium HGW-Bacteroidetes-1]|nr:MAG: hypothetical protein CVT92_02590 [Bacteroidetes bacterium HGW-Bacteroidetes-1]